MRYIFTIMAEWLKAEMRNGKQMVFDPFRKRYVAYTPEEHVRQCTLRMLVEQQGVPRGLIAVECPVKVNRLNKRCDIVVFDKAARPLAIVECKAATVAIDNSVLDQAVRYYTALKPRYLVLTNGVVLFCFRVTTAGLVQLEKMPMYEEMTEDE